MAAFLTDLTAAFTKILACVGETATAITGSPFLAVHGHFLVRWRCHWYHGPYLVPELRKPDASPEMAPAGGVFLWRYLYV